ncbi:AsmA-like C-terminal domain-containing protein [Sulfurovum sp. zt1-1]|uniref:AsmA-like C-terminal domain-containing protein n=2 Tax=Sulfurovum zhangzhouensis TaxID=3019067 RepID=A0ABT7QVZ7_9BACT|nr:AsmA-like C-terminal domain-containing protein [Sulfurovum zhangzhouensis]
MVLIVLVVWLKVGIRADYLHVGPYRISGLYIKLDKKLTLSAHHIVIPKSKSNPSFSTIDRTFDRIKGMLQIFDYVALHDIIYENNRIDLVYADNMLHINTKDYEIAGKIERKDKRFEAEVPLLYIKAKKITLSGNFTYSHYEDRLHVWGRYDMYGIQGNFTASKVKNNIHFDLQSDTFDDLKPLMEVLPLTEVVKHWSVERIQAQQYKLKALKGNGTAKGQDFTLDLDTLTGVAELSNAEINFKDGLESVYTPKIILEYKKGGLYFDLDKPVYQNKALDGSKVSIIDLTGSKPTTLKLDLHVNSPFDDAVQKILKAYHLPIPVLQQSGTAETSIGLDVVFKSGDTSAVIDVDVKDARLQVYKLDLSVESGHVHYEDGIVSFDNLLLKDKMYSGTVEGSIKLNKKKADILAVVNYLHSGEEGQEKSFEIKNKKFNLALDYHKGILIKIPELELSISEENNITQFSFEDLNLIKPYVKDKEFIQEGGNVDILTDDFKTFTFNGLLRRNTCFFYEGDDLCHTKVPCSGTITPKGIDFYAFDKRLHFNETRSRVTLNKLNIDLKRFIEYMTTNHEEGTITEKKGESLVIIGNKSNLRYENYTLVTDSYDVEVKPNGDIKAIGSSEGDIVKFEKKGNIFSINALRIKDDVLHPLIDFKGLKKGRYSLKVSGNINKVMNGRIIIEGGVMKDFKAYNNTLALINTLPALATLQDPGFSKEGFKIKKGVAEYKVINGEKIVFDSIYIKGKSSTIVGKGFIDIKQNVIDIQLAIRTAKTLGNVMGKIPFIGYILMGEDKSMTLGLTITGTLDKPKVETSAAEEILILPLEIIKRTIESPKQMLEETKRIEKEKPDEEKAVPSIHEQLGLEAPNKTKETTQPKKEAQ